MTPRPAQTIRKVFGDMVARHLYQLFARAGFQREGRRLWWERRDDAWAMIELRLSQRSTEDRLEFTIGAGAWPPGTWQSYRSRVGHVDWQSPVPLLAANGPITAWPREVWATSSRRKRCGVAGRTAKIGQRGRCGNRANANREARSGGRYRGRWTCRPGPVRGHIGGHTVDEHFAGYALEVSADGLGKPDSLAGELESPWTNVDGTRTCEVAQPLRQSDRLAPHRKAGWLPRWANQDLTAFDTHVDGESATLAGSGGGKCDARLYRLCDLVTALRAEAEHRHESVAQDLLNISRVGAHQRYELVHERADDRIHHLGINGLDELRETAQVREQNGDMPTVRATMVAPSTSSAKHAFLPRPLQGEEARGAWLIHNWPKNGRARPLFARRKALPRRP